MKKNLLIILLILTSSVINSQTLTLKTGLSVSNMKWENSLLPANIYMNKDIGFTATLGIDYLQKKYFWISSDIGYVQVKCSGNNLYDPTDPFITGTGPYESVFHFLKVNTLFHGRINLAGNFYPYIGIGPELNYLLNYEDHPGQLEVFDNHGDLNNLLYGFAGAAGIRYETKRIDIGFEFLYSYAFNKMLSIEAYTVKNEISMAYYTCSITAGYKF